MPVKAENQKTTMSILKLVFDEIFDKELKVYLINQPGIIDVEVIFKDLMHSMLNINNNVALNILVHIFHGKGG